MSDATAIELMSELCEALEVQGDDRQAHFLLGVCDALYGADCAPSDPHDEITTAAYSDGYAAACKSDHRIGTTRISVAELRAHALKIRGEDSEQESWTPSAPAAIDLSSGMVHTLSDDEKEVWLNHHRG